MSNIMYGHWSYLQSGRTFCLVGTALQAPVEFITKEELAIEQHIPEWHVNRGYSSQGFPFLEGTKFSVYLSGGVGKLGGDFGGRDDFFNTREVEFLIFVLFLGHLLLFSIFLKGRNYQTFRIIFPVNVFLFSFLISVTFLLFSRAVFFERSEF